MGTGENDGGTHRLRVRRTSAVLSLAVVLAGGLAAQNPAVTIAVDARGSQHAINPNIYGVAYGNATTLADLNSPLNRYGGNNTTRYNWMLNADNRANDWYYESIGDSSSVAGERGDSFISTSKGAGAQAMLTIPMIGWLAKLGANRSKLASFSIAKYGNQTGNDWQWFWDAGNGVLSSNNQFVTGNDRNDANSLFDSTYQQQWVQHLVGQWGTAANGGLRYYILDNEHSIWFSTHRDVYPTGPTMAEIRDKIIDYAGKIKAVDPTATIVGPEEWGWSGYFYSGYDQQYGGQHGWGNLPDRANNGGSDYLPWLLSQLKQRSVSTGVKYLDVFSVHYYPQSGEFGNDTSVSMQQLRNRSTRSLWDPSYVDQSWINDKVELIPRLKNWVSTYYAPGTPVAITEYNWGAESHINGATTQADIWGIFGREGLDMATRWTTPDASTPTYKAMKLYRNYDGNKSSFGDISVSTVVPNPDNLSAFGALRSLDGALTVVVINKYLTGNTPVSIILSNFTAAGAVQVYQLTSSNVIARLTDLNASGAQINTTVPPQSITLFVAASAGTGCTYNISPTSVNLSAAGATGTVSLTTGSSCSWTAATNSTFVSVTGASSGTGSAVVGYAVAQNNSVGRAGTLAIGGQTFTVTQAGAPPAAVAVSPSSGSGMSRVFAATYSDPGGASGVGLVYFLVNSAVISPMSCFVEYNPGTNGYRLLNDAGTTWSATVPVGSGSASNGQCTISGAGAGATLSGNNLTVNFPISFNSAYAGAQNVILYAADSSGQNSGWQQLGTWTVPGTGGTLPPGAIAACGQGGAPCVASLVPANGSGPAGTFTAIYTHPGGAGQHALAYILFLPTPNIVWYTATGSCLVEYNRISNAMRLINDAGTGWLPGTLGVPLSQGGTLANSHCTLDVTHSSASINGNLMTVAVKVTFASGFTGQLATFLQAFDMSGNFTSMTQFGNWMAAPAGVRQPGPYVVGVSPTSGAGSSTTLTFTAGHTSGVPALSFVTMLISSVIAGGVPCQVFYFQASNTLNLVNDGGTAMVSTSGIPPGTVGTLANSRCSINTGGATSAVAGNNVTVSVPMTFQAGAFGGTKKVYVNAFDNYGLLSHWVTGGTWGVQ